MKNILLLTAIAILGVLGAVIFNVLGTSEVSALAKKNVWSEPKVIEETSCDQLECGNEEGTHDVIYQKQCIEVSGQGQDACELKICPEGYPNKSIFHSGYCYKGNDPDWPEDYVPKVDNIVTWTEKGVSCWVEEVEACEQPLPSVTPTPEPQPEVREIQPQGPPQGPACVDLGGWAPTITRVWREDADTVGFEWTKSTDNADDYVLYYGLSEDNLPWNKKVENEKSTTVDLPDHPNVHVWGAVEATDGVCVGNRSVVIDP